MAQRCRAAKSRFSTPKNLRLRTLTFSFKFFAPLRLCGDMLFQLLSDKTGDEPFLEE